jgi:hypothetical protein
MRIRHVLTPVLLVLSLAACLEVDLKVAADGSAKGTMAWDAGSATEAEAKKLVTAEGVTVKSVQFKDIERKPVSGGAAKKVRRVTAELEATKLTALNAIPLFKPLGVTITLGEADKGARKLTIVAKDQTETTAATDNTDNVVKLAFPGKVTETSAKADGNAVTWTFTANEYFSKPSVDLSVVYAEK